MIREPSTATHQELNSIKKQQDSSKNNHFNQVLHLVRRLPASLINRLLHDLDGHPHYKRIESLDLLEDTQSPNSTFVSNICSKCICTCTDGFLIENGTFGKLRIDDKYVFAAPGYHKISVFGSEFFGTANVLNAVDRAVTHFTAGFVSISVGKIGVLLVGNSYSLLAPGAWQWNDPAVKFVASVDITKNVCKLGPFTLLTVKAGVAAITYKSGSLKVLGYGNDHDDENENFELESVTSSPQKVAAGDGDDDDDQKHASPEQEIFVQNVQDFESLFRHNSGSEEANGPQNATAILFRHHNNTNNIQQEFRDTTNDSFDTFLPSPAYAGTELKSMKKEEKIKNREPISSQQHQQQEENTLPHQPQKLFSLINQEQHHHRTYFLDIPSWEFFCFLPLKTQTDHLEGNDLLSKDNVELVIKSISQWKIVDPHLAIVECGEDFETIRKKVNELVRAAIARIVAGTTVTGMNHHYLTPVDTITTTTQQIPSFEPKKMVNPLLRQPTQDNSNNKNDDDQIESFILPPTPQCGKQGKTKETKKPQDVENQNADLAHLMQSDQALNHMRDLQRSLSKMGIQIIGIYVPERRMKNDDIRREVANQAVIGIKARAEMSSADAKAYATIVAARSEAEAINELSRAHAEAGKKLGAPTETAARMALSEITAKALMSGTQVTLFSGAPFDDES